IGVVALEREEEKTRQEAAERVAPDKEPHPATLAEVQDPERDVEELVLVDLEELVTGVALEDLDEGLVVVAASDESTALDDALHLSSEHRNLPGGRPVGRVGEEAEEAALAGHRSLLVEAFEADVVQVSGPVDRGARICLRQVEEVRRAGQPLCLRRQLHEAMGSRFPLCLAQNA